MNEEFTRFDLVAMARHIIDMDDEIRFLRCELARLHDVESERDELVMSSIRHSNAMLGGILKIVMVPGVAEAIEANREVAP